MRIKSGDFPREPLERPLKIGLISDWFHPRIGGIESHLQALSHMLVQRGHIVRVLTPIPGEDSLNGIKVYRLPVPLRPILRLGWWNPSTTRAIASILEKERFDLVHCHHSLVSPVAICGSKLAEAAGVPVVFTFHSLGGNYAPLISFFCNFFRGKEAEAVFSAVSPSVASDFSHALYPKEVHLLPNIIDVGWWRIKQNSREENSVNLVTCMRMTQRKRGKALIRVFRKVLDSLPAPNGVKFTLIGDGPQRKAIEKLASELGVSDRMEFTGYRDREYIRNIFKRSDIFVMASLIESFGIAAMEARCAGLPVAAMKKSGIGNLIVHEKNGLLADSDAELVENLVKLIADSRLRSEIAFQNRRTEAPPVLTEAFEKHLELYRAALTMRNPGRDQ
ncbi:MAG: glycosyltransferase family 4 protein [Syntrophobacteraceae bacterium]